MDNKLEKELDLHTVIVDIDDNAVINFEIEKDEKGVPLINPNGTCRTIAKGKKTIKDSLLTCLNNLYKGEEPNPELLLERGQVIQKIKKGGLIKLEPKDLTTIRNVIAKGAIQPDEYMQIYSLIF